MVEVVDIILLSVVTAFLYRVRTVNLLFTIPHAQTFHKVGLEEDVEHD